MRLLRLSEVQMSPRDRVFYYSRTWAVALALIALGTVAWLVFYSFNAGWKLGYYIAGVIVLFSELLRRFITARFRPTNWLARTNDEGVFIQFRSYLNYHLPAEDLTVVFVSYSEIRSARLVRERVQLPNEDGGYDTQFLRYVELELEGDIAPLGKALQAELIERAPQEKRWYGSSSTVYQDHPVRMQSPPFVQMRWRVVPCAQRFLEALRPYTTIGDPVSLMQDFAHMQGLSREEQQLRLRELTERGETITSIYIARKLYGCGLTEAKEMVEGLRRGTSIGN